jgi:hypothetical protein
MNKLIRTLPVLAVAAFLAGCEGPCNKIDTISGPGLTSGTADFTTVASVGTSISAGYQSGGLVNRHQMHAFPALFAAQVGKTVVANGTGDFTYDGISNDGISGYPPTYTLLEIKSLSPLVINNVGRTPGGPQNLPQATDYHNLAVPGEVAYDMVDSTFRGPVYATTMFNLVYRQRGLGVQQVVRRAPTFITYEFGANEVLGSSTAGVAPSAGLLATYTPAVRGALGSIHAGLLNTKVAIFNVPNVTSIPFFTTFRSVTIDLTTGAPVALIGPGSAPLDPGDLVLLTAGPGLASGRGFPVGSYNYVNPSAPGTGAPLTDAEVLNTAEQSAVASAISGMNASLDSIVANRPWTVMVDMNGLLADISANGYHLGSTTYTSSFVTGGIFSLDGVHPTDLAHAILCNKLIDAVNAGFGSTVPRLNVANFATATSSRMTPAGGEGASLPARIDGLEAGLRRLFQPLH